MYARDDRSLPELFSELTNEISTLVRQEIALAKSELSGKFAHLGRGVGMMAAGGAIAYAGVLAVVAGLIVLLANLVPWWASAFIVGLAVAAIGYFMIQQGMNTLKQEDLVPRQTMATFKRIGDAGKTTDRRAA